MGIGTTDSLKNANSPGLDMRRSLGVLSQENHLRAADNAFQGGGEGGAADRGGAGRWGEVVGNGCVCLPGACGRV